MDDFRQGVNPNNWKLAVTSEDMGEGVVEQHLFIEETFPNGEKLPIIEILGGNSSQKSVIGAYIWNAISRSIEQDQSEADIVLQDDPLKNLLSALRFMIPFGAPVIQKAS